ncbi:MAG: DUF6115 domain-containing protein [Spirochaetales bacterium]
MSGWLAFALSIIAITVVAVALNGRIRARTSQQAALDEIKREVGSIITELNQTTERNIELVENRIETLRELIGEADRRVKALKRDIASHQQAGVRYDSRGTLQREDHLESALRNAPSIEEREAPIEPTESYRRASPPDTPETRANVREQVRALYLQGLSLERIAVRVGVTVGEVELILSLQQGAE